MSGAPDPQVKILQQSAVRSDPSASNPLQRALAPRDTGIIEFLTRESDPIVPVSPEKAPIIPSGLYIQLTKQHASKAVCSREKKTSPRTITQDGRRTENTSLILT